MDTTGKIVKTYRAKCAGCHNTQDVIPSWDDETRRFLLYQGTAEYVLRNMYGWGTRKGVWYCYDCLHPESGQ